MLHPPCVLIPTLLHPESAAGRGGD